MPQATSTDRPVKVLKFGGSSVGDVEGLKHVVNIVRGEQPAYRTIVVVSATAGTTDALVALDRAEPREWPGRIDALRTRHASLAADLLGDTAHAAYERLLVERLDELGTLAAAPPSPARTATVLATGERLSAPLVAFALRRLGLEAEAVDATGFILTDDAFESASVDLGATGDAVRAWHRTVPDGRIPVMTGFVGRAPDGRTTVLGRGGSDYSAALVAEAVGATKLDRWTDVDGLHTADPRRYDGTGRFLYLLLEDASTWNEASRLGMHPAAFEPVRRANIPVHVRCTRFPQGDGTLILPRKLAGHVREHSRRAMKHATHRDRRRERRSDP